MTPEQALYDIIHIVEKLERFAIENYGYQVKPELIQSFVLLHDWSYSAKLALGHDPEEVLARYNKTKQRLEIARNTKHV